MIDSVHNRQCAFLMRTRFFAPEAQNDREIETSIITPFFSQGPICHPEHSEGSSCRAWDKLWRRSEDDLTAALRLHPKKIIRRLRLLRMTE